MIPVKMIKFATAVNIGGKSEMFLQPDRDFRLVVLFDYDKNLFIIQHKETKETVIVFPTNISHFVIDKEMLTKLVQTEEHGHQEPATVGVRRGRPRVDKTQTVEN